MKNEITLHGYLGKDPDLTTREGKNGNYDSVAFSLGVSRDYGDETDWFYCVMNGKRAVVIDKYFSKGSEIIVTGRMESYKPKAHPDQTAWIVKMTDFDFCGSRSSGSSSSGSSSAPKRTEPKQEPKQTVMDEFDDLPDSFEAAEEDIPF